MDESERTARRAGNETAGGAEEFLRAMLNATPFSMHLWNKNPEIIDCNLATLRLFETSGKRGFIDNFYDFSPESQPDGRASRDAAVWYVKKTFEEGYLNFEWMFKKPDGEPIPSEMTLVRVDVADDSFVAAYVTDLREMTSIQTELKNALERAESAVRAAEAANRAKSSFLSTMSHEIRTPMNAILGITDIQLQSDGLDANAREAFEKVYTSGDLLLGIINDILDLSKIEAGRLELMTDKYEIASLISDTAQLNMMRIGSKEIEFSLAIDERIPSILIGDELRLKQILNNLLSNAFKYTDKGSVVMSVSAEKTGDENVVTLVISIADTGQGMSKEQIDSLFDEYARFNIESNRSTEGTGLGMSIVKNLLDLMNGVIAVESALGKGSEFTVRLPQAMAGKNVLGKEIVENLRRFQSRSRAQMRRVQISREPMPYGSVLLVDDVDTNIYVAKGLLAPYGLHVDSAGSGFAAVEMVSGGNEYDIIFMDHMMPKMDGVETTSIIRGMGYTRPIVALTANAVSGQADIFRENGFDDFISKPIDIRQLNAVLNKLIRDKQPPEMLEAARRRAEAKDVAPSAARRRQVSGDMKPGGARKPTVAPRFAEIFFRDATKALAALEPISKSGDYANEDRLRAYIINIHGIKSALANVGETALASEASALEVAGREKNYGALSSGTPGFLISLRAFAEEVAPGQNKKAAVAAAGDDKLLTDTLAAIAAACADYDEHAVEAKLAELKRAAWPAATAELIEKISEFLLHSEFDEIVSAIDGSNPP